MYRGGGDDDMYRYDLSKLFHHGVRFISENFIKIYNIIANVDRTRSKENVLN